jgi:hypothetical protein
MKTPARCISILVLCFAVRAFAGVKPDFSGDWVLTPAKSVLDENGTAFLPVKLAIVQNDSSLSVVKSMQRENEDDFTFEDKMTLDGRECKSEFMNSPRTITAAWSEKGDTLRILMKISFQGGEASGMTLKEAWSLGADKSLSIKHNSTSSFGDRHVNMVYEKKGPEPGK